MYIDHGENITDWTFITNLTSKNRVNINDYIQYIDNIECNN